MSKALATKNVAAVLLSVALVLGFTFSFATPANAQTLESLQAQIQALLAQIAALQGGGSQQTGGLNCSTTFTQNLRNGSSGGEVMAVQKFLNSVDGTQIAVTGAGSPGNETSFFGPLTAAAVVKFQEKFAAEILTPVGLSSGSGFWGPSTRAKANALCAAAPGTPGTPTTPGTVGGNLVVGAGAQPANSLAPQGASRVPFTTFTLTNTSNAAVTVNGVTVQRSGLAQDAAFSGVVLVDSNNIQIGTSKTFNSNHQATVGDTFVIQPGQSMTLTVAGNMNADLSTYAGQVAGISVVGINSTATVSGSLPITGAQQTLNATLAVGSISTTTSSIVPPTGSTVTKNIGDTGVKFSGIRFQAGSTEDLKLFSIRWRQVGSASSVDLANVVTIVDGTSYPTIIDASGKYYTTIFPGGLLIGKGNNLDVYVQGDIVGSNASSRTIDFDIDKVTDVYFVGQLYGYGIAPSGTFTPWYNGDSFSVSGASVTTIGKDTGGTNAAQNVAVNVSNEPLGGYVVDLKGEPISVQSTVFTIATSSTGVGLLTNVSIVDENGAVVAGPVDATGAGTTLTFTDTITYPTGRHVYSLRGKLPSGFTNGGTVTLSTNPSSQWTSITGQTTGNSVTLTNGNFTLNTMTVKGATLTVSVGTTPVAQSIIAGAQGVTFSNIILDASQSGEDVRISSLALVEDNGNNSKAGAPSNLSTCQVWDGATALNGGSNVVNPSGTGTSSAPASSNTFTFDNSLVIPKGTVKTLAVKCNISSSADSSSQYQWGITASPTVTGVNSGSSATVTLNSGNGNVMTIASAGTLTATAASTAVAQPSLNLVPAGTAGVTIGNVKFTATNEDVQLQKVGLTLTNGTYGTLSTGSGASSNGGQNDVVTAYLYNGATLVGTATFGGGTTATSTLLTPVTIPANGDLTLTIRADLANIGNNLPGGIGDTVKVDPLNAQALGLASSQQINIAATAGVNGVQMFRSVPTVANLNVTCSNVNSCNGTSQVLKSFTVTANAAGSVSVQQFEVTISTSSAAVTNVLSQVLDQSGNVSTSTFGVSTATLTSNPTVTFTGGPVIIPAGATYTFQVIGDVAASATTWSVNTKVNGDSSALSTGSTPAYIATTTSAISSSNFIWSGNSTTTSSITNVDWSNGFQVNGLPGVGF